MNVNNYYFRDGGVDYGGAMGRHDSYATPQSPEGGRAGDHPGDFSSIRGFQFRGRNPQNPLPAEPQKSWSAGAVYGVGGWLAPTDVNSDAGVAGQVLLGQQQAGASVGPAPAGERALGTGSLGTSFVRSAETMGRPADRPWPASAAEPPLPSTGQPGVVVGRVNAAWKQPAGGLASLDFTLAIPRTEPLLFTTPRGSMEITARNVSSDLVARVRDVAIVVIAALAAWAIAGLLMRGRLAWIGWLAGSWLLLLLGVLSIVAGVVPLLGLAAIVLASTLKVHRWTTKRLPPSFVVPALAGNAAKTPPKGGTTNGG